jgi:hypothetical protein
MTQYAYEINTSGEFVSEGGMLVAQLSNNITITPTLSAEVTGFYMSGARQGYIEIKSQGSLSVGLRQTLLKNKMTLSLNAYDILNTITGKASAKYDNVNYRLISKYNSRTVNLTLRYNFGSTTVRAARYKSTGIEEEASRAR